MVDFTKLLSASDAELVDIFNGVTSDPNDDFIVRINKIAAQLGLNHTQLICALGFNKYIRDLSDIYTKLGFRSYKLLSYRCNELFCTDTYKQMSIDNILDIYSERLEDQQVQDLLREMLGPRLEHIESAIDSSDEPSLIISYRMEVHSIYTAGIADRSFCEARAGKDIGKFRIMANETKLIVERGLMPPSNLFFMDSITPEEKKTLIEGSHITQEMIKNRLQNAKISARERELLEEYF